MIVTVEELGFDRALIVQEHWCDLLLSRIKLWEMRSGKTSFRGRFGLIKSGSGTICGSSFLCDCLPALRDDEYFQHSHKHQIYPPNESALKWRYPWVLEDTTTFETPVKYKHPKGAVIWVKLNNTMLAQI